MSVAGSSPECSAVFQPRRPRAGDCGHDQVNLLGMAWPSFFCHCHKARTVSALLWGSSCLLSVSCARALQEGKREIWGNVERL